uniref:Uncharacterized protein n=1 Tax=Arion vulgaris TaxID=1028688 RepID=A0A0B7B7U0_9EUPU
MLYGDRLYIYTSLRNVGNMTIVPTIRNAYNYTLKPSKGGMLLMTTPAIV